jgi:hypothetical protein
VLAPDDGSEIFLLVYVVPHDDAYTWAAKRLYTVNTATRAVEVRNVVAIEQLTPPLEQAASQAPARLFAKHSDTVLRDLGIDDGPGRSSTPGTGSRWSPARDELAEILEKRSRPGGSSCTRHNGAWRTGSDNGPGAGDRWTGHRTGPRPARRHPVADRPPGTRSTDIRSRLIHFVRAGERLRPETRVVSQMEQQMPLDHVVVN